jgi:hypothetical protein
MGVAVSVAVSMGDGDAVCAASVDEAVGVDGSTGALLMVINVDAAGLVESGTALPGRKDAQAASMHTAVSRAVHLSLCTGVPPVS